MFGINSSHLHMLAPAQPLFIANDVLIVIVTKGQVLNIHRAVLVIAFLVHEVSLQKLYVLNIS